MNGLVEFDQGLFRRVNGEWHNPLLDAVMPVLTDLHRAGPWPIVALAAVLALWVLKKRGWAAKAIVLVALSVALSDMVNYRVLKPHFNRPRPQASGIEVRLLTGRHTGLSFPSNHAANTFAAANTLAYAMPGLGWIWFAVAILVSYSRVYVGVHFPLDVVAGASVGILVSMSVWRAFGRRWLGPEPRDLSKSRSARRIRQK